MLYSTEH